MPTSVTIGIKSSAEMLEEAKGYYASGFRILKIKTGLDVAEDVERVSKLHEQFGTKMLIRVGCKPGYTIEELQQFITKTRNLSIELIEQPLPVGKEKDLLLLNETDRHIFNCR